jgi:hypothetical protein
VKNQYALNLHTPCIFPFVGLKILQSRGIQTVLLYIFIKQRHVQTFRGIIHVCQAILETGSGRSIDSLTVYINKAETCINILRYNTCMSSYPGDRKWTKRQFGVGQNYRCTTIMAPFSSTSGLKDSLTYIKWDARTLTHIPGNTAHWFFAFFWLTEGSRNKT